MVLPISSRREAFEGSSSHLPKIDLHTQLGGRILGAVDLRYGQLGNVIEEDVRSSGGTSGG
jgi:hypothetical protein